MNSRQPVDLSSCDREPIRIPGSIQPHGILFVLDPERLRIRQASANAGAVLSIGSAEPTGRPLSDVLVPGGEAILAAIPSADALPQTLGVAELQGRHYGATAHRSDGAVLLELEEVGPDGGSPDQLVPHIRSFIEALHSSKSSEDLGALVVRQIRALTGFDRAMVYRFDEGWNGTVIAEDRNEVLPSYLDLRFPASDIPAQARDLYRLNRVRLIPDARYQPVPLLPEVDPSSGRPTDLSFAALRSVSPVHLEYMRNMGTGSSMSVSVLVDDELWGLISCHSRDAHRVPPAVRAACDLLGQIFALHVAAQGQVSETRHRIELQSVHSRLLAHMAAEENFIDGLIGHPDELMHMAGAHGAGVVFGDRCECVGLSPSVEEVREIAAWLQSRQEEVYATDALSAAMPEAAPLRERVSGLLAVSVSQLHTGYVMWFRPEVVQTVTWGGDPTKPVAPGPDGLRLHPRQSFDAWKETVRGRSTPWRASEVETAAELRNAIVGIVLRKAEELADLAQELTRTNKELEAFSYSVSHDLRAPFRHIVGFAELLREAGPEPLSNERLRHLDVITEAAHSAGRLVDDLLKYSQMGRASLLMVAVDMNRLVAEVRRLLSTECRNREIDWRVAELPPAFGDPVMLRQAWQNLLGNAVKYTRHADHAVIEVGAEVAGEETIFFVRDNGVGFNMAYVGKLFGVFQRLHRVEEFEGTGIGLANVRRIAERHGGRVWAEGRLGEGATFFLALPHRPAGES